MSDIERLVTDASAPSRRVSVGVWVSIGIGVALMIAVFASRFGNDPRILDSPLIGTEVSSLELEYLDRQAELRLGDLRGEVIVINFWASWCIPCRAEHQYLTAANRDYAARGVRFVGVVHQDSPAAARAFLDDLGWGEGYLYVLDSDSTAAVEFGVFGVPETFFVDRDGVIAAKIAGPVTDSSLEGTLDRLLTES